jgi:hypothetical protein
VKNYINEQGKVRQDTNTRSSEESSDFSVIALTGRQKIDDPVENAEAEQVGGLSAEDNEQHDNEANLAVGNFSGIGNFYRVQRAR